MKEIVQTPSFRCWEQNLKIKGSRRSLPPAFFRLANGLPGDVKPVGEGVSELRIHYGPGYRIYFKHYDEILLVLLSGGNKAARTETYNWLRRLPDRLNPMSL